MPMKTIFIVALLSLGSFSFQSDASETVYMLQANPFAQPVIEKIPEPKPEQVKKPARQLELRGTMTAGEDSLANVDGEIVAIGEEFEGYRLVSVKDGEAVFSKDGKLITLTLDEDKDHDSRD